MNITINTNSVQVTNIEKIEYLENYSNSDSSHSRVSRNNSCNISPEQRRNLVAARPNTYYKGTIVNGRSRPHKRDSKPFKKQVNNNKCQPTEPRTTIINFKDLEKTSQYQEHRKECFPEKTPKFNRKKHWKRPNNNKGNNRKNNKSSLKTFDENCAASEKCISNQIKQEETQEIHQEQSSHWKGNNYNPTAHWEQNSNKEYTPREKYPYKF